MSTCDIRTLLFGWNCYTPNLHRLFWQTSLWNTNTWNIPWKHSLKTLAWNPNRRLKHLVETIKHSLSRRNSSKAYLAIFPWSPCPVVYLILTCSSQTHSHIVLRNPLESTVYVEDSSLTASVEDQHRKHEKGVQRVRRACFSATQQLHFRAKLLLWAQQLEPKWAKTALICQS